MKYISLLVVIIFIAFTFWFSKKTDDLTIDQMNRMNNMITRYMTDAVQNNNPNITDIDFSNIDTEVVERGKEMKAHFKFSYMEPNAEGDLEKVYRKGTFRITSEDGLKWVAQIEQAGDVQVEYLKPFEINAKSGTTTEIESSEDEEPVEIEEASEGEETSDSEE